MRNLFLILIFLTIKVSLYGQAPNWENASKQDIISAFQKSSNWFSDTRSYSFKLKYASFKDANSKIPIETSEGYYKRVNENCITEAVGIKTIQNKLVRITIDTSDKIITVMDPGKLTPPVASSEGINELLTNSKFLKKIKQGKNICYRIDFLKNEMYEAYEFVVNENGVLEKLIYYYAEQIEKIYSEKTAEIKIRPRLEINFLNHQSPAKWVEPEFSEKDIIGFKNEKAVLLPAYKEFRVLDYRLKKTK